MADNRKKSQSGTTKKKTTKKVFKKKSQSNTALKVSSEQVHRFIGISLAGGKTDKTCLAVIEYFPKYGKIFLAKLIEKIKSDAEISTDLKVQQYIQQYKRQVETIAFDVPLSMPKCIHCTLPCPGYEVCDEPEINWMRTQNDIINLKKKPKKQFTPYTQRCVELYFSTLSEDKVILQHALGANLAPLTARAFFLKRRLDHEMIEVSPKMTLIRLGKQLKVSKSHLHFHRHAVSGDESRMIFLKALAEQTPVFVYHQDYLHMVENNHLFESFLSALTAFLKFTGQTEPRPKGFPEREAWLEFPKNDIKWK